MLRHILVGVDGSESSKDAVALAGWLAKAWNAHLDAVHIVDTVYLKYDLLADIAGSMGFEPFGNFTSREEEILNDLGDLILESFRLTCEDEQTISGQLQPLPGVQQHGGILFFDNGRTFQGAGPSQVCAAIDGRLHKAQGFEIDRTLDNRLG